MQEFTETQKNTDFHCVGVYGASQSGKSNVFWKLWQFPDFDFQSEFLQSVFFQNAPGFTHLLSCASLFWQNLEIRFLNWDFEQLNNKILTLRLWTTYQ